MDHNNKRMKILQITLITVNIIFSIVTIRQIAKDIDLKRNYIILVYFLASIMVIYSGLK
jgi:hypothetical protein